MTAMAGYLQTSRERPYGNTHRRISKGMLKCGERQAHTTVICSIGVDGYELTRCSTGCWQNFFRNNGESAVGVDSFSKMEISSRWITSLPKTKVEEMRSATGVSSIDIATINDTRQVSLVPLTKAISLRSWMMRKHHVQF